MLLVVVKQNGINWDVFSDQCRHISQKCDTGWEYRVEVFLLWFSWVRIQSCLPNFESDFNPDPVPTRFKQSDSCLSPVKYVNQTNSNVLFSKHKSKSNPDPDKGMKTSLMILLEAAGAGSKKSKIQSMHTFGTEHFTTKWGLPDWLFWRQISQICFFRGRWRQKNCLVFWLFFLQYFIWLFLEAVRTC